MKYLLLLLLTFFSANCAYADGFTVVPTAWRLESYGVSNVVLWYTPSTCAQGQIILSGSATPAEHNRLYATVMAGKAAGIKVFINYTAASGVCVINSFGLDGG